MTKSSTQPCATSSSLRGQHDFETVSPLCVKENDCGMNPNLHSQYAEQMRRRLALQRELQALGRRNALECESPGDVPLQNMSLLQSLNPISSSMLRPSTALQEHMGRLMAVQEAQRAPERDTVLRLHLLQRRRELQRQELLTRQLLYAHRSPLLSSPGLAAPQPSLSSLTRASLQRTLSGGVSVDSVAREEQRSAPRLQLVKDIGRMNRHDSQYIDVSDMTITEQDIDAVRSQRRNSVDPFPLKLHKLIVHAMKEGKDDIITFLPHGRAFQVHSMDRFMNELMPKQFKQSKWPSFARQLNLYGFQRLTGLEHADSIAYFHELFLRGRPEFCWFMQRVRLVDYKNTTHGNRLADMKRANGTFIRTADPPFYTMTSLPQIEVNAADQSGKEPV